MDLANKIIEAQQVLKLAAEMSAYYYDAPLILCYSGGKDSDVMLDIAKKCLRVDQFEVLNSHTTVDAPETVYHIREVFKQLEREGIKTTIQMPVYQGKPTSMWKLIETKGMPPTRLMRFCCAVLKEASTPNRMAALGVREVESVSRRGKDSFVVRAPKKADAEYRSLQHTYAMFELDKTGKKDAYQCKVIQACKLNKDTLVNPIYKFTDEDIWQYIQENNVKVNPLYAQGFKRVGCVGCPLGGPNSMKKEFARWPKYRENYVKAFDRMLKSREVKGLENAKDLSDGEAVMRWWLGDNPNQITLDDL